MATYKKKVNPFTGKLQYVLDDSSLSSVENLEDLLDVEFASGTPTDGQVLKYDSVASKWNAEDEVTVISNLEELLDVEFSSGTPTDGQALVYDNASGKWKAGSITVPEDASDINNDSSIAGANVKDALEGLNTSINNNSIDNIYSVDDLSDSATIYHVAVDGDDANSGLSRTDGFLTIQHAIDTASDGDVILVYAGTYEITQEITCNKGLTIVGVHGAENTIIEPASGTSCRCLYIYETKTAVVRGFTFQNGYTTLADADTNSGNGGGVCIWQDVGSSPSTDVGSYIIDCIIKDCYAQQYGGGAYMMDHKSAIINCKVHNCTTSLAGFAGGGGVGLRWEGYARNCVIYDCNAAYGAGILCYNGACQVHNCTIVDNLNAGVVLYSGSPGHQVYNSIIYHNVSNIAVLGGAYEIKYTDASPQPSGTNNVNIVPSFVDRSNDNYELTDASDLVDIGLNLSWHSSFKDINGKTSRYINSIGAYRTDYSVFSNYILRDSKASEILNNSSISGGTVKDALDHINTNIDNNNFIVPKSSDDASAPNNSIYYSTDQSKLVYKDSGGVVNDLY